MVAAGKSYDEVVDSYIARYGGEHVLANPRSPFAWVVPVAAFGGALTMVIGLAGLWIRRNRRRAVAAPKKPAGDRRELEDKLDDELDEIE